MGVSAQSFSIPAPLTGDNNRQPHAVGKKPSIGVRRSWRPLNPAATLRFESPCAHLHLRSERPSRWPFAPSFPGSFPGRRDRSGPVAEFPETAVRNSAPPLGRAALVVAWVGVLANSADAGLPAAKRPIAPPRVVHPNLAPHAWITIGKETEIG